MVVDLLFFGLAVWAFAAALNKTAFNSKPASKILTWTLTIIVFSSSVIAMSMAKAIRYSAISDMVGFQLKPENPLDLLGAFTLAWFFYWSINRRSDERVINKKNRPSPLIAKWKFNNNLKRHSIVVVIALILGFIVFEPWFTEQFSLKRSHLDAVAPMSDSKTVAKADTNPICDVHKVYDGDTLTMYCKQQQLAIRIWGIDAPEIGQKPWGNQSQEYLKWLINGKTVQAQIIGPDQYGRTVARLFVAGQDVGLQMVRNGYAIVYEQYNNSKDYLRAQAEAKRAKFGVWSQPGDHQDPVAWRRKRL
ncbi:MAG: thermonuclease family protein [Candidatus Competibacteraceae bacterium]|nr:thermonuclease family protein [Candidatus Competibacteraceae bacterium]